MADKPSSPATATMAATISAAFEAEVQKRSKQRDAAWSAVREGVGVVSKEIQNQLADLDARLKIEQAKLKTFYDAIDKEAVTEREKREKLIDDAITGADNEVRSQLSKPTDSAAAVAALAFAMNEAYRRRVPLYELQKATTASKRLAAVDAAFLKALNAWRLVYVPHRPGSAAKRQFPAFKPSTPAVKPKTKTKSKSKRSKSKSPTGRKAGANIFRKAASFAKRQAKRVGRFVGLVGPSPAKSDDKPKISEDLKNWIQERERQRTAALFGNNNNDAAAVSSLAQQIADDNGAGSSSLALPAGLSASALVSELRRLAAEFLLALGQLRPDLLDSARKRVELRRERQTELAESGTAVPQLRKAIQTLRGGRDARALRLVQARLLEDDEIKRRRSALEAAERALKDQELLAEQTRFPTITKNKNRTRFPDPSAADYAVQIAAEFPDLRMPKPSSNSSRCGAEPSAADPPREYQTLIADLMDPDNPSRGILANFGVGAGKTRAAVMAIENWFVSAIDSTGTAGPAAVVLVPSSSVKDVWLKELKKWIRQFDVTTESLSAGGTNIVTLRRQAVEAIVIVHRMTLVLPSTAANDMDRTTDDELVRGTEYVLPAPDYKTHPAYGELSTIDKELLSDAMTKQIAAVKNKSVAVPVGGLIVVDEAHYLPSPAQIARDVTAATTVLAWSNVISMSTKSKLLLLTATPADERLTDLFKLLNLENEAARTVYFEGGWRRALARDEPEKLQIAYTKADEAENLFVESQLFEPDGRWKSEQKSKLQQTYGPFFSYITLENDPGVYPRFTKNCGIAAETCTYVWTGETIKPVTTAELNRFDLPKPKTGRNLLVPYAAAQQKVADAAMSSDLDNFSKTRRLGSDKSKASAADIDYGASERIVKSSVLASIGMKTFAAGGGTEAWSPKLAALVHLLSETKNDKVFAYSTSSASGSNRVFAPKTAAYLKKSGYVVLSINSTTQFLRDHAELTDKQLVDAWYRLSTPANRVVLFAKAPDATAPSETLLTKIRDFLKDIFGDPRNVDGSYIRAFVGDRSTSVALSLLDVMVVVLLDVPTSETLAKQVEGRALRFCSHRHIPHNRWQDMVLWRFISIRSESSSASAKKNNGRRRKRLGGVDTPVVRKATGRKTAERKTTDRKSIEQKTTIRKSAERKTTVRKSAEPKPAERKTDRKPEPIRKPAAANKKLTKQINHTNEEYQYRYLQTSNPAADRVIEALSEAALDCRLFRNYNGRPAACVGTNGSFEEPPSEEDGTDRFCPSIESVLLQDSKVPTLFLVDPAGALSSPIRSAEFENGCRLVDSKIELLQPPGYIDVLINRALAAPRDPAFVALVRKQAASELANDNKPAESVDLELFINLLRLLSEPPKTMTVRQELDVWKKATSLSNAKGHAALLASLVRHRTARISKADDAKYQALLAQLESTMRMRAAVQRARSDLLAALSAPPSFAGR